LLCCWFWDIFLAEGSEQETHTNINSKSSKK